MRSQCLPPGAAAAMLVLAGCGSSPPARFFTLDPIAPAAPSPVGRFVAPIRVDAVHVPPDLDRPELVREASANTVVVSDFSRWSAPLGQTARRVLTQDLTARLPAGTVIFPEAPKPDSGRGLIVDMLALSASEGRAVLDVSWTIAATPRARANRPSAYTYRLEVRSSGAGPEATAADLSALLAKLADAIAAQLYLES